MRHFLTTTVTAGVMAAAALGLAGTAGAAVSAGPDSPTNVVKHLEAKGYEVIVTTIAGNHPGQCTVTSVHPGQATAVGKSKEIHGALVPTSVHRTMYLNQRC